MAKSKKNGWKRIKNPSAYAINTMSRDDLDEKPTRDAKVGQKTGTRPTLDKK